MDEEQRKEYKKNYMDKIRADPILLEQYRQRKHEYYKRYKEKIKADPELYNTWKKRAKDWKVCIFFAKCECFLLCEERGKGLVRPT